MSFEVLLSAMFLEDESYIDTLHVASDAVIINQCDRESSRELTRTDVEGNSRHVTYIESCARGLSRSRNLAIARAKADICILCDNDVEYEKGYAQMITDAYERHPDADVIVFYIKRKEKPVPNYQSFRRMNYLSVLKIFSPEISFKRESVSDIRFDERFGAGSTYIMGEENIFLYDCLKKGLKVYYEPIRIATLREVESTWFKGYDEKFFVSRGANYAAMSRFFSLLLIMQFAVRKRNLYRANMSMKKAISLMLKGRNEIVRA